MKSVGSVIFIVGLVVLIFSWVAWDDQSADIIFIGDHIITVDSTAVNVTAVAVAGQNIVATGSAEEVLKLKKSSTRIVELGNNALVPGFIDAHGHMTGVAKLTEIIDLASPPVGRVENIDDIVALIESKIDTQQLVPGTWVLGFGYDDSLLEEKRHPNRDDLDRVSSDHPVLLTHVSGHLATVNSAALRQQKIDQNTENPPGGVIRRRPGSREPNGVLEETAMGLFSRNLMAPMKDDKFEHLVRQAVQRYTSYGITTIQDGGTNMADIERLRAAANRKPYAADVVVFPWSNSFDDNQLAAIEAEPSYTNGLRLGGIKFGLDGSPQGRTAFLSLPYNEGPPGAAPDYRAYPTYPAEKLNPKIARLLERGTPTLVHANGDAAIDMLLDGVTAAFDNKELSDHRTVIIHAQLMRKDQLERTKKLGLVPSYYSAHSFFWGDWHRRSFGEERAAFISPAAETARMQIPFTIHNDAPIVPPDMMRLMWVAVNRKTRSDFVLGPDQRLTPMQALHAITLGAAYQYFEENKKGSITPGKQADLVILERNPLLANPDTLKDISIIETFARGQSVFKK
jgi:predicted amidohydrolase YtcJ